MMDHVFIGTKAKDGKLEQLAVIRTNRSFRTLIAREGGADQVAEIVDGITSPSHLDSKFVVVCHFVEVQKPLVNQFQSRAWICTSQLAWPLVYAGLLRDRSLKALASHYDIPHESTGAAEDASTVFSVYSAMIRRYRTALITENVVNELGGIKVSSVRKYLGI